MSDDLRERVAREMYCAEYTSFPWHRATPTQRAVAHRRADAAIRLVVEAAAGILDAEVARHRREDGPRAEMQGHFCEAYGCSSLKEFAATIRALGKGAK